MLIISHNVVTIQDTDCETVKRWYASVEATSWYDIKHDSFSSASPSTILKCTSDASDHQIMSSSELLLQLELYDRIVCVRLHQGDH